MKFLSSLDKKDRILLISVVFLAFVLAVLAAIFSGNKDEKENPTPSSFTHGRHGASAAYETLARSGYKIEHWERPLAELAAEAGPQTVVIIAEPYQYGVDDMKAMRKILDSGGRVLATGIQGGALLPDGASKDADAFQYAACKLKPEGFDALASTGEVWMVPTASWKTANPEQRVEFNCAGQPAVIEYEYSKGHVVWWASATPLENASVSHANNLDLLLNSVGPAAGHHVYWDESLHGDVISIWSFSSGLAQTMLVYGLLSLAVLVLASFSRRSGPLRPLPVRPRTTPVEYIEALGSLYHKAGATETALAISWERFRRRVLKLCGMQPVKMDAEELALVIRRRFPMANAKLEEDLKSVEEAARMGVAQPRMALALAQKLYAHQRELKILARSGQHFVAKKNL
jgi:hypothetical protein